MATEYISVVTGAPEQVPAYLYGHSKIIYEDGRKLIIEVTEDPDRLPFVSQYQADRLSSGLHGARRHKTEEDAHAHLMERLSLPTV